MSSSNSFRGLRLLLSVAPCLALASCFGMGTVYVKNLEYPHFDLIRRNPQATEKSPILTVAADGKPNPTRAEVTAAWGQPDGKRQAGAKEIWTYERDKSALAGVVPMVGIGVPLVAPVGKEGCDIYFARNVARALKAVDRSTRNDGLAIVDSYDDKRNHNRIKLHRFDH